MKTLTTKDLKSKYPYIVAYSKYMDSNESWVEQQLWLAYSLSAPFNTISINSTPFENNVIKTLDAVGEQTQKGIAYYC